MRILFFLAYFLCTFEAYSEVAFRYARDKYLSAGDSLPVSFELREVNLNAFILDGAFYCVRPGIYYFSAQIDSPDYIGVQIFKNGKKVAEGKG